MSFLFNIECFAYSRKIRPGDYKSKCLFFINTECVALRLVVCDSTRSRDVAQCRRFYALLVRSAHVTAVAM